MIVFDKTGTLTSGVPEVIEVVTVRGTRESTLLRLAASAESGYEHPVARALRACARRRGIALVSPEPGSEEYAVGLGLAARVEGRRVQVGRATWLTAEGLDLRALRTHLRRFRREHASTLCVAIDGRVVGVVAYSDGTRPESAAVVRRLRAGGRRRVLLLSGDAASVAANVARELGIDEAVGGLLPDDKADYVRRLQAAGHIVAMVGDGINDAPALARADIGISIAGSTDVAMETADVILLEGGLARLEVVFRLSEQAMGRVHQDLGVVIFPNAVAIALGALGRITPLIAAVINNGATLLAVLVGTAPLIDAPRRRRDRSTGEPARARG
jgi:Cu2+-exporting ATPase